MNQVSKNYGSIKKCESRGLGADLGGG